MDSLIFLYGYHTVSNACGCGSTGIAPETRVPAIDWGMVKTDKKHVFSSYQKL
jgi:hypothetical protein